LVLEDGTGDCSLNAASVVLKRLSKFKTTEESKVLVVFEQLFLSIGGGLAFLCPLLLLPPPAY
jgi:hypothetical protein